jgi:hypothetical protein
MAPLETWEVVKEVSKGAHLVGVVSTSQPAEVASRVFSPPSVPFSAQSKGVLPAFPDLVPLVHPPPHPLQGGRPHILHSLVHWCLTSHTSISRVPPHRTQCHHPRLPRLGSPFSRASLCRKQARREAITYKSPSIANETNCLAVDRTTSVSSSVRHTSYLRRWF